MKDVYFTYAQELKSNQQPCCFVKGIISSMRTMSMFMQ